MPYKPASLDTKASSLVSRNVNAVASAAASAVEQGFLLPEDAASLINAAKASAVLR